MKPDINSKEYKEAISVEQMRRSDEYTIKNYTDSKQLMLRAAKGIFDLQIWLNKKNRHCMRKRQQWRRRICSCMPFNKMRI